MTIVRVQQSKYWIYQKKKGANVDYYDPFVATFKEHGKTYQSLLELGVDSIVDADLVIITTAHTKIDYEMVQKHAKMIFDTKNAMRHAKDRANIELL